MRVHKNAMTKKQECLDDMKAYLGIVPHIGHISNHSGFFYNWLKLKYGEELIKECEEELKGERIPARHD